MTPAAPAGSHHPTSDEAAAPVAAAGSHHPTSDDDAAPVAIAGDDLLPYYCNHNEDPQKVDVNSMETPTHSSFTQER